MLKLDNKQTKQSNAKIDLKIVLLGPSSLRL